MAKEAEDSHPVRVTKEAIQRVKIAAGYTGETVSAYLSRIAVERADADIDRLHAELRARPPADQPADAEAPARPSRRKPKAT